jgi:hypothetical protein
MRGDRHGYLEWSQTLNSELFVPGIVNLIMDEPIVKNCLKTNQTTSNIRVVRPVSSGKG